MNLIKKLLKRKLLTVAIIGFVLFAWVTSYFVYKNIYLENSVVLASSEKLPVRLKIPEMGVDAVIEYVGLTEEEAMEVPKGPQEVAWYKEGPRPGELGSAVIAGHSGWKDDIPAVFDDLSKLKKGDKIYIEDNKGMVTTFVVNELKSYDPNVDAKDIFFSNDGLAHLNLITCSGVWDIEEESHSLRLVVFTDIEI